MYFTGHIYQIKRINGNNRDCYIGSSIRLKDRWRAHRRLLRKNEHPNDIIQRAWNKYKENNFVFEVLEKCIITSFDDLFAVEQYYLDILSPKYNIAKIAGKPPGTELTPVHKLELKTKRLLAEYDSQVATSEDGFDPRKVGACCRGERASHKGFGWCFADGSSPDFIPRDIGKKIIRYDLDTGEDLQEYEHARLANKEGYNWSAISMCCHGLRISHLGYGWCFADGSTPFREYKNLGTPVISYYPLTGKDINRYESMAAAEQDGFSEPKISLCCAGKRNTHGGLGWRKINQEPRIIDKLHQIRPVECVDIKTGEVVKEYDNAYQARNDGFNPNLIRMCLYGKRVSHKGFAWCYKGEKVAKQTNNRIKTPAVDCIDKDGFVIKTYDYVARVKEDGFSPSKVSECCKEKRKSYKGFYWTYVG